MSEKRFRAMSNDVKQLYCIESVDGEMFSIQEVVDLLNNLHQENQELQEKIMKVKQSNNHYYTEYYRIEEENEQLKEKLQSVTMLKDDYEELIESFEKKYGKNIEDVIDDE